MNGLIVMYHYVRPDRQAIPAGIRPLLTSEFQKQLDWLSERYEILPANEFLRRTIDRSRRRTALELPPCLLTFDDGTKDHAQFVTPMLLERGLSGVFFVLSGPAEHGTMPLTHAIHWLLSGNENAVWESFQQHAHDHLGGLEALGSASEAQRIYHYESPIRARIKYAANMALPSDATEQIVKAAADASGRTMKELAQECFVSADDIRMMNASGMTIGLHGCTHRSLQMLGCDGIHEEIHHCSQYISKLIGRRSAWYACPFGGSGAAMAELSAMHDAMKDVGVTASVSTEKRFVNVGCDALALPRFDAIDLPPRKALPLAA
jgi:peptidoglycan/xylan/chitin deacetylase (PgdA/CDA1 family)